MAPGGWGFDRLSWVDTLVPFFCVLPSLFAVGLYICLIAAVKVRGGGSFSCVYAETCPAWYMYHSGLLT